MGKLTTNNKQKAPFKGAVGGAYLSFSVTFRMSREGGSDRIAFLKTFQSRVRSSRVRVQRQDLKEENIGVHYY